MLINLLVNLKMIRKNDLNLQQMRKDKKRIKNLKVPTLGFIQLPTGTTVRALGWGRIAYDIKGGSKLLQEVNIITMPKLTNDKQWQVKRTII